MSNVLKVSFGKKRTTTSKELYQYDYGQILKFIDLSLPDSYEVHFANRLYGDATIQIGDEDGVAIPDAYLETGLTIYAWVYLHTTVEDGETAYAVTIPVAKRAQPTNDEPTQVQQSTIEQALAALEVNVTATNNAVTTCQSAVTDAQAARDGAQAYMQSAESYKNTSQSILSQIQNSTNLGYITIGSTRLTEEDLIRLLNLLNE